RTGACENLARFFLKFFWKQRLTGKMLRSRELEAQPAVEEPMVLKASRCAASAASFAFFLAALRAALEATCCALRATASRDLFRVESLIVGRRGFMCVHPAIFRTFLPHAASLGTSGPIFKRL